MENNLEEKYVKYRKAKGYGGYSGYKNADKRGIGQWNVKLKN